MVASRAARWRALPCSACWPRSLLDFAKLVETFDKAGTSFVSITQSFNTTTSMGRLTLNMLLSFAQFEREVTAERIRDKIAASKARGMWMGGNPPLGYKPDGRSLAVVEEHASMVRHVFEQYRLLGNVRLVADRLTEHGIEAPQRQALTGRTMGGRRFTRGQLYRLLSNAIYIGEIHHRDQVHAGKHQPIVDRATWEEVQRLLADNRQGERSGKRARSPSLLAGRIVDEEGEPLVATHAVKGKLRYRYYVSRALQHGTSAKAEGIRIPASEIEAAVIDLLATSLDDVLSLLARARVALDADQLHKALSASEKAAARVRGKDRVIIRSIVQQVTAGTRQISIELSTQQLCQTLAIVPEPEAIAATQGSIALVSPVRLTRTGRSVQLVQHNGRPIIMGKPDAGLIALLRKARTWWLQLQSGDVDIATIARNEQVNDSWVSRMVRLNFLAPAIVDAILAGTQPTTITAATLRSAELPIGWEEQKALFRV